MIELALKSIICAACLHDPVSDRAGCDASTSAVWYNLT